MEEGREVAVMGGDWEVAVMMVGREVAAVMGVGWEVVVREEGLVVAVMGVD